GVSPAFQLPVQVQGRLSDPEQFGDVVIRTDAEGRKIRVRDVARVELASQDYAIRGYFDSNPGVALAVIQQPGSGALSPAAQGLAATGELRGSRPRGVACAVAYNPSEYVQASVGSGQQPLLDAVLLVVAVVLVCPQTWGAAISPRRAVAVDRDG